MNELKACGVLVVRTDPVDPRTIREFLLMRHPARWDLPKGHVDEGEDEIACALRELWEETGLASTDVELDPGFRWTTQYPVVSKRTGGQTWLKTLVVFLGRLRRDREIVCTEHTGYRWFPWRPPHDIQAQTINPLLAHVEQFLDHR
jgi:bis(5'-nucleosidyl)-tetraphosphatase